MGKLVAEVTTVHLTCWYCWKQKKWHN